MSNVQLVDNEVWESEQTDVTGIERALRRLRLAVRSDEDEGVPAATTDAAALNIAVVGTDEAALDEAAEAISELSQRHPSRSILFLRRPDESDGLSGSVNAFCTFMPGAARQVCCEQVRITGRGSYAAQLHSILPSLLVPGVPLFVWWRGQPPIKSDMYARLRELASRMIVDSAGYRQAFAELAEQVRQCESDSCALSDLAWARLANWREQVARLFDPDATRPYLELISEVTIEAAAADYPTEAVLLAAWLATQLDWHVEQPFSDHGGTWKGALSSYGRTVAVSIAASTSLEDRSADPIARVLIDAGGARLELALSEGGRTIHPSLQVHGEMMWQGTQPREQADLLQLVAHELELPGNDPVYERTLAVAEELARQ